MSGADPKQVNILGIRGIPAAHGGFETFAARLAPFLRDRGYRVVVYCQADGAEQTRWEDDWEGIHRVHLRPSRGGALGTMEFDFACIRDVTKRPGVDLVLGYNTALFCLLQRLRRRRIVMNMDGIEWKRAKWGLGAKIWFYVNEVAGANLCTIAVADHPEISRHVERRCLKKTVMIPYGGDRIEAAPATPVTDLGVEPGRYFVSIARVEPENSILELVRAYSTLKTDVKLVVLGRLYDDNPYHGKVREAAGPGVVFPGAIYDQTAVSALRFHARAYLHGHQVGGTNPSLVESLGAGNAILAHDNRFNRWTTGNSQFYFRNGAAAAEQMHRLATDDAAVAEARLEARKRHAAAFVWDDHILPAYEKAIASVL